MFSWKNIKETWTDKVTYGLDGKEKALGVLEVLGKSVVSVGTGAGKIAKEAIQQKYDSLSDEQKSELHARAETKRQEREIVSSIERDIEEIKKLDDDFNKSFK